MGRQIKLESYLRFQLLQSNTQNDIWTIDTHTISNTVNLSSK